MNTCFGFEIQPVARTHAKRVVPRIEVANGRNAVVFRSVVVGHLRAQPVVTVLGAPGARETDEELPVLLPQPLRVFGPGPEREAVCVESGFEAGEVGYIFDQRLLPSIERPGKG